MADNEERILITKVSSNCHALRIMGDPFDDEEGLFCDKNGQYVRITDKDCAKCKNPVLAGISRSEAEERMAMAICSCDSDYLCGDCSCLDDKKSCKNFIKKAGYDKLAEAALNALLEVRR